MFQPYRVSLRHSSRFIYKHRSRLQVRPCLICPAAQIGCYNSIELNMGTTNYEIEIEIFEGAGCDQHRLGQKFKYPEDIGNICPCLLDSINSLIRVLQFGGTLPWKYNGTKYEKIIDPNGTTTEYIRCPDPTDAGVVAKINRRKLSEPKEVGWL